MADVTAKMEKDRHFSRKLVLFGRPFGVAMAANMVAAAVGNWLSEAESGKIHSGTAHVGKKKAFLNSGFIPLVPNFVFF